MDTRKCHRLTVPVLLVIIAAIALASQSQAGQTQQVVKETVVAQAAKAPEETTWQRVQREKVVRFAFNNEMPMSGVGLNGKLIGQAPMVAEAIFKKHGIKVEAVVAEWSSLIPALHAKRFDMIASCMYITPARCEQVAFSIPDICIGIGVVVKAGNPYNIHSYKDILSNPRVKVGCIAGGSQCQVLRELGLEDSRRIEFPDNKAALAALQSARIDVFSQNTLNLAWELKLLSDPGLQEALPFEQPTVGGRNLGGCCAYTFRKDDKDFIEWFNAQLKQLRDSGDELKMIRHLGYDERHIATTSGEEFCRK